MCQGDLTEWTKCTMLVKEPKRKKFRVPHELKVTYDFLNEYKFKGVGVRLWEDLGPSSVQATAEKKKTVHKGKALEGMKFVVFGKFKSKSAIKEKIEALGGTVSSKVNANTAAVITTTEGLEEDNKIMSEA